MPTTTTTTPTPLQEALREDAWAAPGSLIRTWPTSIVPAWRALLPTPPVPPDCTCPIDCACDHEHE